MKHDTKPRLLVLTRRALRAWPLPGPDAGGDKESRGRVLIVGGSAETPGAVILPLGYLARQLAAEVSGLLRDLASGKPRSRRA